VYKVDYFVETPSASQDGLSPTELLADVLWTSTGPNKLRNRFSLTELTCLTLLSCQSWTRNGAPVDMQVTSYVENDYYVNRVEFRKLRIIWRVWPSKKVTKESYDLTCESGARDNYLPFQVLSKYRTFPL